MREKGGDISLRVFASNEWLFTNQQGEYELILYVLFVHSLLWMEVGDDGLQLQPTNVGIQKIIM